MAANQTDVIAQAIADTEKEMFAEAFGKEEAVHDESGDTSREEMVDDLDDADDEGDADGEAGETTKAQAKDGEGDDGESDDADGEGEQPRDEKGKFVAKDEVKDDADKAKPKGAADAEKSDADKAAKDADVDAKGRVPPGRLREQTERTKAAEAALETVKAEREAERTAARREVEAINARLDGVLAALKQTQPQPKADDAAKPKPRPDLFERPDDFVSHLEQGVDTKIAPIAQGLQTLRIETSMMIAEGRHGETFTKAYDAVGKLDPRNPDHQMVVRRIWGSPNPGEALVKWHRGNETLREVGDDPAKYKEKIAAETREALMKDPEFRKQLLEGLREEANGAADGKPRTTFKLPPKLNGASGARSAHHEDSVILDDSDSALFEGAFAHRNT